MARPCDRCGGRFIPSGNRNRICDRCRSKKIGKVHCEGEWNKERRSIDLSKTNARTAAKALGNESKAWVGHQLFFEVYKTKTSDGTLTDAINIREVK